MRDRSALTSDAAGLSLSRIACVKTRASRTFDHSAGERALHLGRSGEGLNSSSLAVTTVESLDGKRGNKVAESPVIYKSVDKCRKLVRIVVLTICITADMINQSYLPATPN